MPSLRARFDFRPSPSGKPLLDGGTLVSMLERWTFFRISRREAPHVDKWCLTVDSCVHKLTSGGTLKCLFCASDRPWNAVYCAWVPQNQETPTASVATSYAMCNIPMVSNGYVYDLSMNLLVTCMSLRIHIPYQPYQPTVHWFVTLVSGCIWYFLNAGRILDNYPLQSGTGHVSPKSDKFLYGAFLK